MVDDLHYVPGDFYRLDDRSGFKVRAKRMRMEWTSLIVDRDLFELRPAQDFVKGVIDDQTVPLPRPRPAVDPTVGPLVVTLVAIPTFVPIGGDENPFNTDAIYVYPPGAGV